MSAFRHLDEPLFGIGSVVEFDMMVPTPPPTRGMIKVRCRGHIVAVAVDPPTREHRWWTVETKVSRHDSETILIDVDEELSGMTHSSYR